MGSILELYRTDTARLKNQKVDDNAQCNSSR